jgi:hypothetical protein
MKAFLSIILAVLVWTGLGAGPGMAQTMAPPAEGVTAIELKPEPGLEALAAEVARRAPASLAAIRQDLAGLPMPQSIEIRLIKWASDIPRFAPEGRGAPEWASGVAYPDLGVVVVATRDQAQTIDVHQVVAHELAHVALGAALRGRAPRWLDEGFAFVHTSDWSMARVHTLTGMVWFGNVLTLAELERGFPRSESQAHRAYAQSYDFVAFLVRRGRNPTEYDDGDRAPFRYFLTQIAGGRSTRQAAVHAYGASLDQLFEEWRADLRQRYMVAPASLFSLAIWVLGALLLVAAFARRRRQNRRRLDQWERDEASEARMTAGEAAAGEAAASEAAASEARRDSSLS